jgi:hypothetical protein
MSLPGRRATVIACAFCASELAAGAYFDFPSFSAHVVFWMLAALLVIPAFLIANATFPSSGPAESWTRTIVIAFAFVVLCGLVLGAGHLLARVPYLVAEALMTCGAVIAVGGRALPKRDLRRRLPAALAGLWIAIVAFIIGTGLSHSPFIAYDSLSYHLFFPARWLQAHTLSIIPTPFSDEAQAYQPGNGELWLLWLMLPFHGDLMARIGQLPFYLLGGTTLYALARRLGATRTHALYAPTFFFITPTVVEQAVGANVDLINAVLFVTALHLGIVAVDRDQRRDWALWGITLGLFVGTKYLALVYLPLLVAIPFIRGPRRRALWALPGIAAFGLPWYLRNWLVAGSPIYPATLTIAGVTVGQGAYSRHAMTMSFMHTSELRLLVVAAIHAFGATEFLFFLPAAAFASAAIIVRKAWWPAGFVLLLIIAMCPLCWFGVGDNADSRFLLPAVVTAMSALPLAFGTHRRLNAAIHGAYAIGIAWILIGADAQLHASLPPYMDDWLSLRGVVDRRFLLQFAALMLVAMIVSRAVSRRGWIGPAAAALIGATSVTLAIGAETWCIPSRCDFLRIPSSHIRPNYLYGSRWIAAHATPSAIAYTGDNLPYALTGSHLANVVSYVNIDRHAGWRFHDYAHAFRRAHESAPAPLASSSGILVQIPAGGSAGIDAPRPRFERMHGARDAWIENLKTRGIGYLFVSALGPYEIDNVWHNAEGFPIEDEWAKADEAVFRLAYENPGARIYEVRLP